MGIRGDVSLCGCAGNGAFGNYRQLLENVTLSPPWAFILDMLRSDKVDPGSGDHPNENYARRIDAAIFSRPLSIEY